VFEKGGQTEMGQAGRQEKEEKQTWTWAGRVSLQYGWVEAPLEILQ